MPPDDWQDAFKAGDLDKMFERILTNPFYKKFEPKAISRPTLAPGDTPETADYKIGGPWMVLFENVVSDEEADRLIELGGLEGYKRSEDVGEKQDDGTYTSVQNSGRTSTNAWCNGICYEDPIARRVMDRISNITGTPELNSEHLQYVVVATVKANLGKNELIWTIRFALQTLKVRRRSILSDAHGLHRLSN